MINSQKKVAMFAMVEEWKKSGKTMREFTSGIGLSKSCFEYWIRKKREFENTILHERNVNLHSRNINIHSLKVNLHMRNVNIHS